MSDLRKDGLQTPEEVLESEIEDLEKRQLHSWLPWVAGMLGLVFFVAVVVVLVGWEHSGFKSRAAERSHVQVELAAPRGDVPQAPRSFQWNTVERAASYVVTIRSSGGEAILIRPVKGTLLVPMDIDLAQLVPGEYVWTVEARDAGDAVLGTGRASFRIGGS
jgi:hypothetical protein